MCYALFIGSVTPRAARVKKKENKVGQEGQKIQGGLLLSLPQFHRKTQPIA